MSLPNQPACHACDDSGVVPGKDVASAVLCACASGQVLGGVRSMSAEHAEPPFLVGKLQLPEPKIRLGAVEIDEQGLYYQGVKVEDAGRAYRTLMAVLHNREPSPEDRPARSPSPDVQLHDLALLLERMGLALAAANPQHGMPAEADAMLIRLGLKKPWPTPSANGFTLERRNDPHNPSNRHNPLNMGRRRSD